MEEESKSGEINLNFLKKINITYTLLVLFLILGVYLRVYHMDFPSIGYHNVKENEYLDEAYFFMNQGNYLHKQAFSFFGLDEGTGYHEEYAEVPLVAYATAILWTIFGVHIWIPRLMMILFMMGSVLLTYFLVKRLTGKEYLSLLSSFLLAIMPLGVYFGRNIQPESPGLFAILLTSLFFVKWLDTKQRKYLMYSGFAFSAAWALKYSFGIVAVPLFFIFPFKETYEKIKYHKKEFYQDLKYFIYGIIPGIISTLLYELTVVDRWKQGYSVDIFRIFDSTYWISRWPSLMSYFNDNYTMWFLWMAILGLVLVIFKYRTRFSRFILGYVFSIFIYSDLMAAKIGGHSYYQMPFLPLVCILSAYFMFILGTTFVHMLKSKYALYIPLIIILVAAPAINDANNRVWGTIFYGQDFLGEYLRTRMAPDERLFAFADSQDLATCSYAKHRCGWPSNLSELKRKEKVFNINYIYIGQSSFNDIESNDTMWKYIKNNYHIDIVGLMNYNGQLAPVHFILKRGGKFNISEVSKKQVQTAEIYDTLQGQVPYYYIQNA